MEQILEAFIGCLSLSTLLFLFCVLLHDPIKITKMEIFALILMFLFALYCFVVMCGRETMNVGGVTEGNGRIVRGGDASEGVGWD